MSEEERRGLTICDLGRTLCCSALFCSCLLCGEAEECSVTNPFHWRLNLEVLEACIPHSTPLHLSLLHLPTSLFCCSHFERRGGTCLLVVFITSVASVFVWERSGGCISAGINVMAAADEMKRRGGESWTKWQRREET